MERLVDDTARGVMTHAGTSEVTETHLRDQNSHARNWLAKSARPPPNTMPEICRFAPDSPNINRSPPITMATRANERASGPVKDAWRLSAARSHGLCARVGL